MVEGIAISVAGMQKAVAQVNKAADAIASYPAGITDTADIVDITSGKGSAAQGGLGAASLEASVVGLKVASQMYEANAKALSMMLEAQKEAFEQLI